MANKRFLFILALIAISLVLLSVCEATSYKSNLTHYVAKQKNLLKRGYVQPTDAQIDLMREAVFFLLQREFAGATRAANAIDYNLRAITHTNGLTYYILESNDPKHRPWGTYIFYLGSNNSAYLIEVPHPEEKNTSNIGIQIFITSTSPAASYFPIAFLMSGSYKGTGDVTLNSSSIFEAVHETVAFYSNARVLQIHGFTKRDYPQIVLTSGAPVPISAMDGLIDKLIQNDFEVGIYDGVQYSNCGATQNEQAKFTNSIGGSFIAVYLNRPIQTSQTKGNLVIDSIQEYTLSETIATETPTSI